jgi:tRNA(adenine34) deaminase
MTLKWMNVAISMAARAYRNKEVPVGAIIVHRDQLVSQFHNKMVHWKSPLAHAEILALFQAQKKLNCQYLRDCQMYVTLEPCALCQNALQLCQMGKIYFGAYQTSFSFAKNLDMIGGIQEEKCRYLLKFFFQELREKKS